MGIRKVRTKEDPILRKTSKIVKSIDDRTQILIDDMLDTMYKEDGVGLAAPQVGILKRIIVIDVGEGPITVINPEIIEAKGEICDNEGCLSVPGENGEVIRPQYVRVKGLNRKGEEFEIQGEGLLARAFCHEIDHLNGILFIDKTV